MGMMPQRTPTMMTEFGEAVESESVPLDRSILWMKLPERHIYQCDDCGWRRIKPPEIDFDFPFTEELDHG